MRLRGAYLEEGGSQYVIRQGSHSTFYLRALTQTRASCLNEEIYANEEIYSIKYIGGRFKMAREKVARS